MAASTSKNPCVALEYNSDGDDSVKDPNYTDSEQHSESAQGTANPSDESDEVSQDAGGLPKGRKRRRNTKEWKKNIRKHRRNTGQEYTSTTHKTVPAKEVTDSPCGCKKTCNEAFSFTHRQQLFRGFYELGDWTSQNAFLVGSVKVSAPKRCYINSASRKQFSRGYYVKNSDGDDTQVCKTFFLQTFIVSNCRLNRAINKAHLQGTPEADGRGKHPPCNKTPPGQLEFVKKFIEAIPTYRSHYTRRDNPRRKYFAPGLNTTKLYKLYKEHCEASQEKPLSSGVFRNIFLKDYNIGFHAQHTDTCKKCDLLQVSLETAKAQNTASAEVKDLEMRKELHLRKAEAAQDKYKTDKQLAKNNPDVSVFSFDLMKTLPTPVLSTSVVYYKRQLWTYAMGIHDAQSTTPFFYMWDESLGSKGPNEVASCLLKHIELKRTTNHIIAYSDACGGQNRNIKVALFWLWIVNNPQYGVSTVDHKFFVSGHSFMDSDKDFGILERSKKFTSHIFTPDEWANAISKVREKNPFTVTQLKKEDLRSTHILQKAVTNRKITTEKDKVEWLKIMWLRFEKGQEYKIKFKTTHQEDIPFSTLDIKKRGKGKPPKFGSLMLPELYPNGHAITSAKLKDLKDLLCFIPPICHEFYNNLHDIEATDDTIPINETEEDYIDSDVE